MRTTSFGSARVFWLDREAVLERVRAAVQQMVQERPEIEAVVLFGSLARGDAVPGSDADLLVILRESDLPFHQRISRYIPRDCGIGVDAFPYTLPEFEAKRQESPLWARAVQEGMVLYGSPATRADLSI